MRRYEDAPTAFHKMTEAKLDNKAEAADTTLKQTWTGKAEWLKILRL